MTISLFELFKIGVGPSSSHTVGPMVAARRFTVWLDEQALLTKTVHVEADLYGSLALTGKGHAADTAVVAGLAGEIPASTKPLTIAHPQPWTFRHILEAIAQAQGRSITFFPIPWRLLWLTLRLAEGSGLRPGFRSDSLISLMHQNPDPSFTAMQAFGITCRPFAITAKMLASPSTR